MEKPLPLDAATWRTNRRPRGWVLRLDATGVPVLLARLAVGAMFIYTALAKLRDPHEFVKAVNLYHFWPIDPPYYLNLTGILVPYIELVCGVVLILGLFRRGAALLFAGMLVFFTWMVTARAWWMYHHPLPGVAYNWFCDVRLDCGCGTGEQYICRKLAENIALFLGSLLALFSASDRFGLDRFLFRSRPAGGAPSITNE